MAASALDSSETSLPASPTCSLTSQSSPPASPTCILTNASSPPASPTCSLNSPSSPPASPVTPQWNQSTQDISHVIRELDTGQSDGTQRGITKKHWKANTPTCANSACNKRFSFSQRTHHCRRCGDVFCKNCTRYKRRLNKLAHPDPQGQLYRVCKNCFDEGPQSIGQTRNLTNIYQDYRMEHKGNEFKLNNDQVKDEFDINVECQRLLVGFQKSLSVNTFEKLAHNVKGMMKKPDWQKSPMRMQKHMAKQCLHCKAEFGTRNKFNCVVCGVVVCGNCSNKDLIIYISNDEAKKNKTQFEAKLVIIKIVGCPEKEPKICQYLRVCLPCHQLIEQAQVNKYEENLKTDEVDSAAIWSRILKVHDNLIMVQSKIEESLPKYQELFDDLETTSDAVISTTDESNIKELAKAKVNISDHFTEFVHSNSSLKKLKPNSKGQTTILRNIIQANCEFYAENMCLFRELERKKETIIPSDNLRSIEEIT